MNGDRPRTGSYEACRECCGDNPGVAFDVPEYVDHSAKETTVDQLRIEAEVARHDLTDKNILHVGVGNSGLARRLAGRVGNIDGLTVSRNEKEHGEALGLANYNVLLLNKHSREFILTIRNRYSFIVDNNLSGFACCKYHFYMMFDNYLWALEPGGQILTDQRGLDWACLDPRFTLTYADLETLADKFPLEVTRLTDTVYSLRSQGRRREPESISVSYRASERDGQRVVEPRPVPGRAAGGPA